MSKIEEQENLGENGMTMSEAECKQVYRYLYPLIKDGYNKEYYDEMRSLEKVDLTKDWVFVSQKLCDKELLMALLFFIKNIPTYAVIDAYKLVEIDKGSLKSTGWNSLYDLVNPRVLLIRYGVSDSNLSDGLKSYIRNCVDLLVSDRRLQGKRTFIFSYGTIDKFLKVKSVSMKEFVNVATGEVYSYE